MSKEVSAERIPSVSEVEQTIKLNEALISGIQRTMQDAEYFEREKYRLEKQIRNLQLQLDRLIDDKENGAAKLEALHTRRETLQQQRKQAQMKAEIVAYQKLRAMLGDYDT